MIEMHTAGIWDPILDNYRFFQVPASESIIHFPSTNSSETYITTLMPLISGSFEAVWGGGWLVNCYPKYKRNVTHNSLGGCSKAIY